MTSVDPLAGLPAGNLLDVPSGAGNWSAQFRERGFSVTSIDLFPTPSTDGASQVCADANLDLPFRNETFDYVLSREGIEHFENQFGFIRECARVLRPGGTIVITTPNINHLSARLSQFFTGQRNLRRGLANEVQTLRSSSAGHHYHGHIFFVDYFRMRYMLRLSGFGEIQVQTDRYSPTSIAMAPLVPLMYAAARYSAATAARRTKKRASGNGDEPPVAEIISHVHSRALLFGKRMIVRARKVSL